MGFSRRHFQSMSLLFGLFVASNVVAGTWTKIIPANSPPARMDAQVAFDERRGRLVLFGGTPDFSRTQFFSDTWEWDGTNWTQVATPHSPPGRHAFYLAYDSIHQVVILYGGQCGFGTGSSFGDMWRYDGTDWQQLSPPHNPGTRGEGAMAFDRDRGVLVLYGGHIGGNGDLNDTWEYDGTDWREVQTANRPTLANNEMMVFDRQRHQMVLFGGCGNGDRAWFYDGTNWTAGPTGPPGRNGLSMGYNPVSFNTVVFGGGSCSGGALQDTWEWNGQGWAQKFPGAFIPSARWGMPIDYVPANSGLVGFGGGQNGPANAETWLYTETGGEEVCSCQPEPPGPHATWVQRFPEHSPPGRWHRLLTYDSDRQVAVLFGGADNCVNRNGTNETWEFNGADWHQINTAHSPPGRYFGGMAYDSHRKVVVLFGGFGSYGGPAYNDTWEYDGTDWQQASPTVSPDPCVQFSMAYDPLRQRVVVRGQYTDNHGDGACGIAQQTWEYDGMTWAQVNTSNQPPDSAPNNRPTFFAWNEVHQKLFYFLHDAVWAYDGEWFPFEVFSCGIEGYGVDNNRGISLFSSTIDGIQSRNFSVTYEWNGQDCPVTLYHDTYPPPRESSPQDTVYFAARGSILLFGGAIYCTTETFSDTWEYFPPDSDEDGFPDEIDCAPSDFSVYPGAPQLCDGMNNDCNDPTWPNLAVYEQDQDGDGYVGCSPWTGPASLLGGDCNDNNPNIHPGVPEICNDIDDNCNEIVDEDIDGFLDADGDGIPGACDNCPIRFNPDQRDEDRDGIGNSCDNCLTTVNPEQLDADSDSVGDACDNCPLSYNPTQANQDGDHVGDVCDNCLTVKNETQNDLDNDGEGDECDYNDGVVFFGKITTKRVNWQSDPKYTTYNLYRGSLQILREGGPYTQLPGSNPYAGRWCGLTVTYQNDSLAPASGTALYWLVAGKGLTGEEPLGDGDMMDRPNANPCP